jgi:glutamine synthetase
MAKTMDYEAINGYKNLSKDDVKKIIKEKGIEMLRLEYIDMNGINRGKLMPADMIDEAFEGGIAFAAAVMAMSFDNTTAEIKGLTEYNYDDMKVVADPSTFVILPYLDKTALILGDIYYHNKPMKQSPRWFLKNMIDEYRKMGLNPVCASEVEFFLYNKMDNGGISPYTNQTNNCYTNNIRIDPKGFLQKLTKIFKEIDFKVLYMNHEYYPGQYEYNWSHAPALRNVDETSMFKGICKDVAEINDMVATFMAKPSNDTGGSGCHFHISLDDMENGENAFYEKDDPYKMSQLMKNFVAGVLKHARPLVAFLAPTINCYKRYRPDSFAPYYIGWGYDNRTTYIRIPEERGKGTRVEVRAASAATNPYLAIGGILAAGLDGIKNNLQPPEIVTTDLYHDKTKQMEAVPRSLFRALAELEKDEWLCECAGADLINNFIGLKNVEVEGFNNSVTDWEWKTYSYHI